MAAAVVAVAGSSGLIGSALVSALRAEGRRVVRIVRRAPENTDELSWSPDAGEIDLEGLRGVDAVVNMCGVGVSDRRWSGAFKQQLRDSRLAPTEVLSAAVAELGIPVLVNASAVGYYGDTRDRVTDESGAPGSTFLARLCTDWEAAVAPALQGHTRVVLTRTGLVLARDGGLVGKLRPLFGLGLGARLGNGRQYMSWISMEDQIRALIFAVDRADVTGPINLTGPAPVTNAEFTRAFGRMLGRPTPGLAPAFALRAAVGEFADEGLLVGQRAIPAALERAGFEFTHHTIGEALRWVADRTVTA